MAVLGSCHELFSSPKRKSSRGEFPCRDGGEGGFSSLMKKKNLMKTLIEYHFDIFSFAGGRGVFINRIAMRVSS